MSLHNKTGRWKYTTHFITDFQVSDRKKTWYGILETMKSIATSEIQISFFILLLSMIYWLAENPL